MISRLRGTLLSRDADAVEIETSGGVVYELEVPTTVLERLPAEGPRVALAMLSTYTAERLARALVEKDVTALRQVSGIGKKTAERLALELADKVADLSLAPAGAPGGGGAPGVQEAVAALVALGYSFADADAAVRAVLAEGDVESADVLIRRALAHKGG